ncbi:MAG: hypothetical protein WD076_11925 [Parvularculaceae bacterium]
MTLESIYYIGQTAAAAAILGSLVFVAFQILQTRNQLKGQATIAVLDYQKSLIDQLLADSELYKIALRGNEDMSSLNDWEQHRFTIWCLKETSMWELCHHLKRQNALDEKLLEGKEKYWLDLHSAPGRREWWEKHAVMLDPEFRRYVSHKLKDRAVRPLRESNPTFDPNRVAEKPAARDVAP